MSTPSGPNPIPQPGKNPPNPPPQPAEVQFIPPTFTNSVPVATQPAIIKVPSSTNPIVAWLKDHNFSSHSIAVLIVSAAGLIVGNQQVRSLIVGALSDHPKWATAIFGVATIILTYKRSDSTSGAAANIAQDVKPETLP
jgi:hypothetical protein